MKMSGFQLVSLCIFAVLILMGVGAFATFGGIKNSNQVGKVVIWGTIDAGVMDKTLTSIRQQDSSLREVSYVYKDPSTYSTDVVNAMASGNGPDLLMISQDQVASFTDKIGVIPYSAISQQTFVDAYIYEAQQLFLTKDGALALPYTIDPLVMYYNKDLLSGAGFASPPQYWNDLLTMAPKLTQLDANSNVVKSAVAMGGWSNVLYAKDILAALFMQAGDPIVTRNATTGAPTPVLGTIQSTDPNSTENPATSALQFYTEFANPTKTTYSWNRSLPSSQDDFVAGDLALYFGLASDYPTIQSRNPNLHFGVAQLPQIQGTGIKMTFGQLTGLAIPRTTPNPTGAMLAAEKLTSLAGITSIVASTNLPSVRSDIQVDTSKDAAQSVFASSALISRGWLDPDPAQTDTEFQNMIESVTSSSADPSAAIFNTEQLLQTLLHTNSVQTTP